MKKEIKWVDEFDGVDINDLVVVDKLKFFTPEQLAWLQKKCKITLELRQSDVDFFKAEAKKHKVSYQAMIRDLLSNYAQNLRRTNAG